MSTLLQNQSIEELSYTENEHGIWEKLYHRQVENLQDKAYSIFLNNLKLFDLSKNKIPQFNEVSEKLYSTTRWSIEPVAGLIGYESYFNLLKKKKFPVATFIRPHHQEDLSVDPDIFHEIFGHCTMLLCPKYAEFMSEYANFALSIKEHDRPLFARLIWFTTETGLLSTNEGVKIFGASILSSYKESNYCLGDNDIIKKEFDVVNVFREPYRADILQKVYYLFERPEDIYNLLLNTSKLLSLTKVARELGEFKPLFPVVKNKYANIGHCNPIDNINVNIKVKDMADYIG